MRLLSAEQLSQIENRLMFLLHRLFQADGLAPLTTVIQGYVSDPGKRIRPQLCVWTHQQISDDSISEPLLDLACGWELFHAFLLAHDDIIDDSECRRGRPSLHRRLAALDGNSATFGRNLCIVAGDLLFSAAMRIWHELDLSPDMYRSQLRLFSRIACTTGFGQAIDICQSHVALDSVDERVLLQEYRWKTAAYTFEGPMLCGAILGGADDAAQDAISRFALELGQAYQLYNDLADLAQPPTQGSDLHQGKRTPALLRARRLLNASQRDAFDHSLDQLTDASVCTQAAEYLHHAMMGSGAIEQTCELIDQSLDLAGSIAKEPAIPARLSTALRELLDSVRTRYFIFKTAGAAPH